MTRFGRIGGCCPHCEAQWIATPRGWLITDALGWAQFRHELFFSPTPPLPFRLCPKCGAELVTEETGEQEATGEAVR